MAKGKYGQWISPEGLTKIEGWARDGLTDEQIAKNMGIAACTLYAWKDSYPEISESLKKGKEVVDREVEGALYRNAIGYDYTETTRERRFNPVSGQYEMIVTKESTKHVKPDTTAQIFWLKNRKPELWRDKQDVDTHVDGELNITLDYGDEKEGDGDP